MDSCTINMIELKSELSLSFKQQVLEELIVTSNIKFRLILNNLSNALVFSIVGVSEFPSSFQTAECN